MKVLLNIGYDGSRYHGFQVQANAVTVQETLQNAVETVFGGRYPVTGCSRTDSGVHALSFYCTVDLDDRAAAIPTERIPYALNVVLPPDIAVFSAIERDDAFHPRYSVTEKEYQYRIWNGTHRHPLLVGRAAHLPHRLDEAVMNKAAAAFLGRHDFAGFMASGSSVEDTVREIYSSRVTREGDMVTYTVSGNGFLYNMVRIMTGTLVAVSEGKIRAEELPDLIVSCDRSRAGMTMPACGLYLSRVAYE